LIAELDRTGGIVPVRGFDVESAADEAGERDEMLLGRLGGGCEGVPFQSDGKGEIGLRYWQRYNFFGLRMTKGSAVEENLKGSCLF